MVAKGGNFNPPPPPEKIKNKKNVLPMAPLLVFFTQKYGVLKKKPKKHVLPVAPLFEAGVDFGVFHPKIRVFRVRVLILRS
jgi:hypothetical protein